MQHGCLEEDRYPQNVSFTSNILTWMAVRGDSNMMPLWFDGDCMSKVLIDNDYLSDSEELDNDYEKDFAINAI